MILDGAWREEQPLRDLPVAKTVDDECEDLALPSCEAGRVPAGRRPRAARDVSGAECAQAACDDDGRRAGHRARQACRAPRGGRPRSRCPPGRAQPRMAVRGRPTQLRPPPPRRRARARRGLPRARASPLRRPRACAMPGGMPRRGARRPGWPAASAFGCPIASALRVAPEPGGFGLGNGNGGEPRKLARRLGKSTSLREQRQNVRISAPRAHPCEHAERERPRERRHGSPPDDKRRRRGGIRPTPLVELEESAIGEQVELVQLVPLHPESTRGPLRRRGAHRRSGAPTSQLGHARDRRPRRAPRGRVPLRAPRRFDGRQPATPRQLRASRP